MQSSKAIEKAKFEADRSELKEKYNSKLNAFVEKVKEAEAAYNKKYLHILGCLEESRRENASIKAAAQVRDSEMLKQLDLKEKCIACMTKQLETLRVESAAKDKWRDVALELASGIIELSTGATFLSQANSTEGNIQSAIVSKVFLRDLKSISKVSKSTSCFLQIITIVFRKFCGTLHKINLTEKSIFF